MKRITLRFSPKDIVLEDSVFCAGQLLTYFFNQEQAAEFLEHLDISRANGWIEPDSFNSLYGTKVLVDVETNTLMYHIDGSDLQSFLDYIKSTPYFDHVVNFYQSKPEQGSAELIIED